MKESDKNSVKTAKRLIFVIFVLIVAAVAFKMYNPQAENEVELFSEDAKKQISVELKNDQAEVSQNIELKGADIIDQEIEKIYLLRVNNKEDIDTEFKVDVVSENESMNEALQIKIYDESSEEILYEGSVKNSDGKIFEKNQLANAAKKNDTKYRIYFSFSKGTGEQYKDDVVEIKLDWSVPEDQREALKMSKTGDVKIILYSFIAMIVITLGLLVIFRNKINPEVFNLGRPLENREEDENENNEN